MMNGHIIAIAQAQHEGVLPQMWIRESDSSIQLNWIAIFSYTASLAVSVVIWTGVFRAVGYLVR